MPGRPLPARAGRSPPARDGRRIRRCARTHPRAPGSPAPMAPQLRKRPPRRPSRPAARPALYPLRFRRPPAAGWACNPSDSRHDFSLFGLGVDLKTQRFGGFLQLGQTHGRDRPEIDLTHEVPSSDSRHTRKSNVVEKRHRMCVNSVGYARGALRQSGLELSVAAIYSILLNVYEMRLSSDPRAQRAEAPIG